MSATDTDLSNLGAESYDDIDVNQLRLDLLDELRAVRSELYRKSAGDGRIRDSDKASARQGYFNAFIREANAEIRLLAAIEDAQATERLDRIEEHLGLDQ